MTQQPHPWPILVVSLRAAEERRAEISRQMAGLGLEFSFLDAVDCRHGVPDEFASSIDRQGTLELNGYPMSDGEYGCALSHMEAYKTIATRGLPGAVILEDDAILTHDFGRFYKDRDYLGYDLVQMCYFDARHWKWRGKTTESGILLRYLAENPFMNAGYTLSRKGAEYFLKGGLPIRTRADWPCDVTRLKAALTVPPIIRHPPPESQISYIGERQHLIPEDFDFGARYAKGWRRLISPSAWQRFAMKRLSIRITPGY